ncbi:unnamed protein product [Rhodiola kirilowii]
MWLCGHSRLKLYTESSSSNAKQISTTSPNSIPAIQFRIVRFGFEFCCCLHFSLNRVHSLLLYHPVEIDCAVRRLLHFRIRRLAPVTL